MAPRNGLNKELVEYKITELQRGQVVLSAQLTSLDSKNDKGFKNVNEKLAEFNTFVALYKEERKETLKMSKVADMRIGRLEKGYLAVLVGGTLTFAGLAWEVIKSHFKLS